MTGKQGRLIKANEPLRGAMNDVLAASGPGGVKALEAVAECGDPSTRGADGAALSMVKRGLPNELAQINQKGHASPPDA